MKNHRAHIEIHRGHGGNWAVVLQRVKEGKREWGDRRLIRERRKGTADIADCADMIEAGIQEPEFMILYSGFQLNCVPPRPVPSRRDPVGACSFVVEDNLWFPSVISVSSL